MKSTTNPSDCIGRWMPPHPGMHPESGDKALKQALCRVMKPVYLVSTETGIAAAQTGTAVLGDGGTAENAGLPLRAYAPAMDPADLGDPTFKIAHGVRYPYVAGAMANGITSVEMVEAVGKAGMLGFFGAAGLTPAAIEDAIIRLQEKMGETPFGFNLIHSPFDTALESKTVQLYLRRKVRRISASAFLDLTLPLLEYRLSGIHRSPEGRVICPNQVVAKVSRIEVARKFLSPAPRRLLARLVEEKKITPEQARLAEEIPVAEDLTAEADSGGHTDNRPAIALLPVMLGLRDEMMERYGYSRPICIGLAGGIATPDAAAAAFAMGAAYILTGSVNQSCIEAGTSEAVRCLLTEAQQPDVVMAPAADMFEMGVKVQVLKRGTMFAVRAARLYELYRRYDRWEQIPLSEQTKLEKNLFKKKFAEEWEATRSFFAERDPRQVARAESDPRHKMALVFRSYLGQSSRWAVCGDADRKMDYQIWCGPSMGAFNQWVKDSFLQAPENRKTTTVAMNLLYGASVAARINWIRFSGVSIPPTVRRISPLPLEEIEKHLDLH